MAVLPAELENVPDDFLHQLEGLLDLGLNQRGEVNYSHVHLHTDTHRQTERARDSFKLVCDGESGEENAKCKTLEMERWIKRKERGEGINTLG